MKLYADTEFPEGIAPSYISLLRTISCSPKSDVKKIKDEILKSNDVFKAGKQIQSKYSRYKKESVNEGKKGVKAFKAGGIAALLLILKKVWFIIFIPFIFAWNWIKRLFSRNN